MENTKIENAGNTAEIICEEAETKNRRSTKMFRGMVIAAIVISFFVFTYLLLYFCENTGA